MLYKSFPAASVKALDDAAAEPGTFEAIVSVFNNVDLMGDVIVPGAFAGTLARHAAGDAIPVLWSHDWYDPLSHLGKVVEAAELGPGDARLPDAIRSLGGLWVKGVIDLRPYSDGSINPKAEQVHRLLVDRLIREFSFAYDVITGAAGERDGKPAYELRELEVHEVGPTLKGANPETQLITAKHRAAKAGRVLSAKNESKLRDAATLLSEVLASVEASADDGDGKAEEPPGAKAEDPTQGTGLTPVDVLALELELFRLELPG